MDKIRGKILNFPTIIVAVTAKSLKYFFFLVDGFNGLRFSARRNGCFTPPVSSGSPYSGSLVTSASESLRVSQAGINPNKAVFTIESKTSQILIVNRNACELLGYTPNELCSMQLSHLLSNKKKNHVSALAEGQLNSEDGTMVLLSGKVVEMTTKQATKVAVSLWIRQIDEKNCLAIGIRQYNNIKSLCTDAVTDVSFYHSGTRRTSDITNFNRSKWNNYKW